MAEIPQTIALKWQHTKCFTIFTTMFENNVCMVYTSLSTEPDDKTFTVIECFFGKIKLFRRIFSRFDKGPAKNYQYRKQWYKKQNAHHWQKLNFDYVFIFRIQDFTSNMSGNSAMTFVNFLMLFRKCVRHRGNSAGPAPAVCGQLPDPQPGRGRPSCGPARHAPRGRLWGQAWNF